MKRPHLSAKRIAVDKTNASLIIIVSLATFVVIFSIVATKALYSQLTYQSRVINKKETTLKQVKTNIKEVEKLNIAYQEFSGATENAIGDNPKGQGDRDGENARIILDALPSKYDFPALTTSLDKLAKSGGFRLTTITGTDDEINQASNQSSANPTPVDMPFTLEASINAADGKAFMQLFERSIRPIKIQKLTLAGQEAQLKVSITAKTYFQPEKKLTVIDEVVK